MIRRLMELRLVAFVVGPLLMPVVIVIGGGLVLALLLIVVLSVLTSLSSSGGAQLHYQCDSAVGPDPAATETATTSTAGSVGETLAPSDIPSTNPFASMTAESGDSQWQQACATAMRTAQFQLPPLTTPNAGLAPACAREIAVGLSGQRLTAGAGMENPSSEGGLSPDGLARYITFVASTAKATGRCDRQAAAVEGISVILPPGVGAQGGRGQRVDPIATSPGDLVFWAYQNNAATRVGVAIGGSQMVTGDPTSGVIVTQAMPVSSDVRVKRVLGGGSLP